LQPNYTKETLKQWLENGDNYGLGKVSLSDFESIFASALKSVGITIQ